MGTPIRVLVADDSEMIRRAVCALLQAQPGIAVCGEAASYAELLKIFNNSKATKAVGMYTQGCSRYCIRETLAQDDCAGNALLTCTCTNVPLRNLSDLGQYRAAK
jgi:hypothetical protein